MVRLQDIREVTEVETCYKVGKAHSGFLFQAEHNTHGSNAGSSPTN